MLDLDMSPYAVFVWASWAVSVLALMAVVVIAIRAARRWRAELKRLEDQQP